MKIVVALALVASGCSSPATIVVNNYVGGEGGAPDSSSTSPAADAGATAPADADPSADASAAEDALAAVDAGPAIACRTVAGPNAPNQPCGANYTYSCTEGKPADDCTNPYTSTWCCPEAPQAIANSFCPEASAIPVNTCAPSSAAARAYCGVENADPTQGFFCNAIYAVSGWSRMGGGCPDQHVVPYCRPVDGG
ncbi:MAG TPA: hypothetical protein VF765_31025 [Polyangiaceae bacterium]